MEYKFPEFDGEFLRLRVCSDVLLTMCIRGIISASEYRELRERLYKAYVEGRLKDAEKE